MGRRGGGGASASFRGRRAVRLRGRSAPRDVSGEIAETFQLQVSDGRPIGCPSSSGRSRPGSGCCPPSRARDGAKAARSDDVATASARTGLLSMSLRAADRRRRRGARARARRWSRGSRRRRARYRIGCRGHRAPRGLTETGLRLSKLVVEEDSCRHSSMPSPARARTSTLVRRSALAAARRRRACRFSAASAARDHGGARPRGSRPAAGDRDAARVGLRRGRRGSPRRRARAPAEVVSSGEIADPAPLRRSRRPWRRDQAEVRRRSAGWPRRCSRSICASARRRPMRCHADHRGARSRARRWATSMVTAIPT